jgi:hypothetical protein
MGNGSFLWMHQFTLSFFGRFQSGMHNRMGDKVVQDFGLSRGILQKLQEVMEREWIQAGVFRDRKWR